MAMYTSDERLCLDSAKEKIVDCDSAEAAFLLVAEGGQITEDDARKYGLMGKPAQAEAAPAEPESKGEEKAVKAAPEDKAVKASANKAAAKDTN